MDIRCPRPPLVLNCLTRSVLMATKVVMDGETIEVPRSLLEQLLKKVEHLETKLQSFGTAETSGDS